MEYRIIAEAHAEILNSGHVYISVKIVAIQYKDNEYHTYITEAGTWKPETLPTIAEKLRELGENDTCLTGLHTEHPMGVINNALSIFRNMGWDTEGVEELRYNDSLSPNRLNIIGWHTI